MSTSPQTPVGQAEHPGPGADPGARLHGSRFILGTMILAMVLICAYWLIWFGIDRNILASSHTSSYYTYENAFPLADGWLVLTILVGVVGIWRRRAFGLLATLLAGGAGVFLGCLDVLFDLENHIYAITPGADVSGPIIEVVINLLTFALAVVIVAWVWRHRSLFLGAPS